MTSTEQLRQLRIARATGMVAVGVLLLLLFGLYGWGAMLLAMLAIGFTALWLVANEEIVIEQMNASSKNP
jgi:hypothetical protein